MKIAVAGIGYVGLSNAVLLSQKYEVIAIDCLKEKVEKINLQESPIDDEDIKYYLKNKSLNLKATTDVNLAYTNADFVIVSTPTDYDPVQNYFNTESVESVIRDVLEINRNAVIFIKSTIPVGFTNAMKSKYSTDNIIFSPEFLREGKALHDNLYPSRIVIGERSKRSELFANLLLNCAKKENIDVILTGSNEAEAIKLFANSYLAMRVSFFNELDTYSELKGLNSNEIIRGVSLDPRIGSTYNNPSFGYGGYCLPKDTKQLLANFDGIPNGIISAIVSSNDIRKEHIAKSIMNKKPKIVGVYRLVMKNGSDNFRDSAIQSVIKLLSLNGVKIIIFEPSIYDGFFRDFVVEKDFDKFIATSDLIITNRIDEKINKYSEKIYSRDVFGDN